MQARKEAKLLPELDRARALLSNWRGSHFDYESAAEAYADAFRAYGLDVFGLELGVVASAIQKERPAVRQALVLALDVWALCDRKRAWVPRLWKLADSVDDDDWRRRFRAAQAGGDIAAQKRLAKEARGHPLPAVSTLLLAASLMGHGERAEAAELLRHARGRHPEDFWIHYELGGCLQDVNHPDPATLDELLGCYWAALAVQPGHAPAHTNLGNALKDKGLLDEAIAEWRKAIDLDPKLAAPHTNLGLALADKRLMDEAIAECQAAIALEPKNPTGHNSLGFCLHHKGLKEKAIAEFQKAIDCDPNYASPHYNLGVTLHTKARLDEAIAEYVKAIALDPKDAKAHTYKGMALEAKHQLDEAIEEFHKAIAIEPRLADPHNELGLALMSKGLLDDAITEFLKAIDLDPKLAPAHTNLGNALNAKGLLDRAITAYGNAIALDPKDANAYGALGQALLKQGRFAEAGQNTRRALDLLPARNPLRDVVTQQLHTCERMLALDEKLPALLKGDAQLADNEERFEYGLLCQIKKRYAAAAGFYTDAFAAEPKLAADLNAQHRYHAACAAALAGTGQGKDAAKLDGKERARHRQQALTWLRADLTAWGELLEKQPDEFRSAVLGYMQHWQQDADFAHVHGDSLAKLPEAERKKWQKLWDDLEALRQRAASQPELVPTPKEEP